jgi:hypothetical protein
MKSVPNLIFYLHKFFGNFSQFLAICFELFSFVVNFNLKIADERAPPVRRRAPRRVHAAARRCRVAATRRAVGHGSKPLSGQRAARPNSLASRARRHDRTLTQSEAAPTTVRAPRRRRRRRSAPRQVSRATGRRRRLRAAAANSPPSSPS